MSNTPVFSVCMPVYNGAQFLQRALDSVLAQTFNNFEIILYNDGSTDDTPRIIEEYTKRDKRIRFIHGERNLGMIPAWDKAMEQARGKYMGLLMHDDFYNPDFMETALHYLETYAIDIITCWARVYDHLGRFLEIGIASEFINKIENCKTEDPHCISFSGEEFIKAFLKDYQSGYLKYHVSLSFFSREKYFTIGGINTELRYCAEAELALRLAKAGARFGYISERILANLMGRGPMRESTTCSFHRRWNDFLLIPLLCFKNEIISQDSYQEMTDYFCGEMLKAVTIRGDGGLLDVLGMIAKYQKKRKNRWRLVACVSYLNNAMTRIRDRLIRYARG